MFSIFYSSKDNTENTNDKPIENINTGPTEDIVEQIEIANELTENACMEPTEHINAEPVKNASTESVEEITEQVNNMIVTEHIKNTNNEIKSELTLLERIEKIENNNAELINKVTGLESKVVELTDEVTDLTQKLQSISTSTEHNTLESSRHNKLIKGISASVKNIKKKSSTSPKRKRKIRKGSSSTKYGSGGAKRTYKCSPGRKKCNSAGHKRYYS
mgnify:CR=1 FL=1